MGGGAGQCFQIDVPNTNVTIAGGSGAVEGISLTTDQNVFSHAGCELILESAADMRHASTGVLGEAASNGVIIGTPGTIQHSAGGGVQIYAGAGITPTIGGPSGPGEPFGPSKPAKVDAGKKADGLNRLNDGIKGVSDVASGIMDFRDAGSGFEKAKAAFETAKGAWDTTKSTNVHQVDDGKGGTEDAGWAKVIDGAMTTGEVAFGIGVGTVSESEPDRLAALFGVAGKAFGAIDPTMSKGPMSGKELEKAQAAQKAIAEAGVAGGGVAGPSDGPRIHQVAPANIDRESGANMTAKVAGDKTTAVDGKIEYTSGASIAMKAFSKVETSSLTFEAHANIKATMKGLALAKVESLGKASLEGKAKFVIGSAAKGEIAAPKIEINASAALDITAGKTTIGKGPVKIDAATTITKITKMEKIVKVGGNFYCDGRVQIKKATDVDSTIKASGDIKSNAKLKNPYFKAG